MAVRKKKAARKTRGKGVSPNNALAPVKNALAPAGVLSDEWKGRLAKYAERDAATATGAGGWNYIGTRGGIFNFNDEEIEELPPVLILGAVFDNVYYEGDYDADNPVGPVCFAIAEEEKLLAPPESLGDDRQCMQTDPAGGVCSGCWANAFGTADRGKGKACKNTRRLALLPADDLSLKGLRQVEGAMLRIPVTSVKQYSTFTNKVTKAMGIPLFMLPARINIEKDAKTQMKVTFEPYHFDGDTPLLIQDAALLEVIEERVKEADAYLKQLPTVDKGDSDDAPKRKAGPARKKAGGKRAGTKKKAGTKKAGTKKASPRRVPKGARKSTARKAGQGRAKF